MVITLEVYSLIVGTFACLAACFCAIAILLVMFKGGGNSD